MKELIEILALYDAGRRSRCALATVVKVEGSSYRRPGARMLVVEDGRTAGSVSGGCLEADVVREAVAVIESGASTCLRYDTTDDDVVFGIGLGCNGVIRILVEPFDDRLAGMLQRVVDGGVDAVIGVRFAGRSIGTEIVDAGLRSPSPQSSGDRTGVDRDVCVDALGVRRSAWVVDEEGEVFYDFRPASMPLVLFGGGHDAVPLAQLGWMMGWRVTVVDHRPAYAEPGRFPAGVRVVCARPEEWASTVSITPSTIAVVMSHNYTVDLANVARLLDSTAEYVGLLGPRSRGDRILAELRDDGRSWSVDRLTRLHAPVGLDIGGDTPETIALSILAEIQSASTGRRGGPLRERDAPIYDPPPSAIRTEDGSIWAKSA